MVPKSRKGCFPDLTVNLRPMVADLIAMYTHQRKGLARVFSGSVASEVKKRASTEVRVFTPSELEEYIPPGESTEAEVHVAEVGASSEVSVLKGADIFNGLSDGQINDVVPMVKKMSIATGESLGAEGELGENIFIIAEGEAQLSAHTDLGDIAARIAGPGESFPVAVLVGIGHLITSANALTDMELFQIQKSELLDLCSEKPEIGSRVFRNVADLFASRYVDTLMHLARSVEKEFEDTGATSGG